MQDLGLGKALGVNDAGVVVGKNPFEAMIWENGAGTALSSLIDPSDPLFGKISLGVAMDINNAGQIIANGIFNPLLGVPGTNSGNQLRAFVLTPASASPAQVPLPAALPALLMGLAGLGFFVRFGRK